LKKSKFKINENHALFCTDGDDWAEFSMVDLKHPCRKEGAMFAFNKDKTKLAEVVSVDDTIGSWFVGDTIGEKY
jgi:hypothetical protein